MIGVINKISMSDALEIAIIALETIDCYNVDCKECPLLDSDCKCIIMKLLEAMK